MLTAGRQLSGVVRPVLLASPSVPTASAQPRLLHACARRVRHRPTPPQTTTTPRLSANLHSAAVCLHARTTAASSRTKIKVNPLTLRNGDIPHRIVQVVNEDGHLSEPTQLRALLDQFDQNTHMLKLVAADPPVVKIVNIEEDKRKEREHEARIKLSKRLSVEDKELQVGWHGEISDLQTKINTARHIIEKGDRVHIVFANRVSGAGRRKIVPDERKAEIINLFEEGMSDVASKWKEDQRTKGLWISYWQPLSTISTEVRAKVVESLVDSKKRKEEQKEARRLKEEERLRKAKQRQAEEAAKAAALLEKL